mgnify:CR=1 FL=1
MKITTEEERNRIFDTLNNPDRPIYKIAHARRTNSSEDYDSVAFRAASSRLLKRSLAAAKNVLGEFSKRASHAKR